MRNIVVYVGGFNFPGRNASAVRVRENAWLLKDIGYEPVLVGKLPDADGKPLQHMKVDHFDAYDIRHPFSHRTYPPYTTSIESVKEVAAHYGLKKVAMIIAYNYPAIALQKLHEFGQKHQIAVAADVTEWYGWEGWRPDRNIKRFFDTQMRIRYVAKKIGNIIVASRFMNRFYDGYNTVVWSFCINTGLERWQLPSYIPANDVRTFIYTGSPGLGMSKDRLNLLIEAFSHLSEEGKSFKYIIQGITKEQYLRTFKQHRALLENMDHSIVFRGRVPHSEAFLAMQQADYSLFIRPDNRVSHVGFPTKVMEAFAAGIPTITNPTSDIADYVKDSHNGLIIPSPTIEAVVATLNNAIELPESQLHDFKLQCREENPFDIQFFREEVEAFINRARNNI